MNLVDLLRDTCDSIIEQGSRSRCVTIVHSTTVTDSAHVGDFAIRVRRIFFGLPSPWRTLSNDLALNCSLKSRFKVAHTYEINCYFI